jgi:hypothetical protein
MVKIRKLDGVAITDHDTIRGAVKIVKNIDEYIIIPGVEVTTNYGHILILNIGKEPPNTDDLQELRDFTEKENGIMVIAHPYSTFRKSRYLDIVLEYVDAIELANSLDRNVDRNYGKLLELKEKHHKGATAGSDSHIPDTIGNAYIETSASSYEDILESIRRGDIQVFFRKSPIIYRLKKLYYEALHRARLYRPVPP